MKAEGERGDGTRVDCDRMEREQSGFGSGLQLKGWSARTVLQCWTLDYNIHSNEIISIIRGQNSRQHMTATPHPQESL